MNATERALAVVVLAAGEGTRMKSQRPKVLHEIAGRPLLAYPLGAAEALAPARLLVVVGPAAEAVREALGDRADFVVQPEPRGTGDAVQRALPSLGDFRGDVLILYGDTPLLRAETLRALRAKKAETRCDLVLLTSPAPLPGRVVRDASGRVARVVEVTDATPEELAIQEGNTGVYLVDAEFLGKALAQLDDDNAQGELYLTDIVSYAVSQQRSVEAMRLEDPDESLGVNTRAELAAAGAAVRRRVLAELMAEGVTIVDPEHTYVDVDVEVGRDTVIEPGCVLRGATRVGERVTIKPHCVIESSILEDDVTIGPSAHLRPGSRLGRGVRVGNFVEVKNSTLGAGVKADHLSYIGDADVGDGASFGCGAITVNYDWEAKHRTRVGAGVRVGCNANLVAPVSLADDSAVAAGTTVTRDVPADALAVARERQRNVEGWRKRRSRPKKDSGS
ncbi:MAG: bifunctional UDP-N-acetylglucosamine diphosphorylase/glucosamine-1-phosphate N-acetyltransferase GlmU [Deltaproteobacteria bacterium]|nr:MAG: bifunctional UDP-N-acetylglucosamine diphosphorylase/glucosamine-1-phosphate N-acetyltransferase GlmU [Deltaproteobacteria bacterium]